mgnify:CR=1 FL=1
MKVLFFKEKSAEKYFKIFLIFFEKSIDKGEKIYYTIIT